MHVVHLPQPVAKVKPERESKQLAVEQKFVPLLKTAPLPVPKPMPEPTLKPMPEQMPQPALDPVVKADTVTASFSDESTGMEESLSDIVRRLESHMATQRPKEAATQDHSHPTVGEKGSVPKSPRKLRSSQQMETKVEQLPKAVKKTSAPKKALWTTPSPEDKSSDFKAAAPKRRRFFLSRDSKEKPATPELFGFF